MAILGQNCAFALATLSAAAGQTLQYRLTSAGAWTAFAGAAFLQQLAPIIIGYDEKRQVILAPQAARLKVAVGSVHLLQGATGSQVRDQNSTTWQVVSVDHAIGQSIYDLQRAIVSAEGDARGSVP